MTPRKNETREEFNARRRAAHAAHPGPRREHARQRRQRKRREREAREEVEKRPRGKRVEERVRLMRAGKLVAKGQLLVVADAEADSRPPRRRLWIRRAPRER